MNRIFSAIANNEDQVLDQLNKDIDIAKEDGICDADQYTITANDDKIILHDKINDEDTEIINLENGDTTFSAVDTNGDPKPEGVLPLVTEKSGKDFSEMTDEELDETIELMSVKVSNVKHFSLESLRTFAKGGWKNGKLFITIGDSDVAIDLKNKVAIVLDENLSTPIDPKKSLVDNLSAIEKFMKENGLKVFSESGASISDKKFSKVADLLIDLEEYIFGAQGDIKKSLQKFARDHKMDFKDAKEAAIMMIKVKDLTDDWGNLNEEEDANGVSQKVKDDLIARVKKFSDNDKDWYVVGILVNEDGEEEVYSAVQPQENQPTKEEVLEFEPKAQDLKYFKVFANEESADAYRDGLAAKMGKTFSDDEEWDIYVSYTDNEGSRGYDLLNADGSKDKALEHAKKIMDNRVNKRSIRSYNIDKIEPSTFSRKGSDPNPTQEVVNKDNKFSNFSPVVAKMFNKKS
jgi:hypothetical protein